jgi:hypothetical protein
MATLPTNFLHYHSSNACTRVPIMSTATAIDAKVSFDPQPTKETFFLLCPLREVTAKQQ